MEYVFAACLVRLMLSMCEATVPMQVFCKTYVLILLYIGYFVLTMTFTDTAADKDDTVTDKGDL